MEASSQLAVLPIMATVLGVILTALVSIIGWVVFGMKRSLESLTIQVNDIAISLNKDFTRDERCRETHQKLDGFIETLRCKVNSIGTDVAVIKEREKDRLDRNMPPHGGA